MGKKKIRTHSAPFKAKVALAAIKGDMTLTQLASKHGVHANQVSAWKAQLLESLPQVFESKRGRPKKDDDSNEAQLYEQIGRLKMELDWLKKKSEEFS
jgi:transposase